MKSVMDVTRSSVPTASTLEEDEIKQREFYASVRETIVSSK